MGPTDEQIWAKMPAMQLAVQHNPVSNGLNWYGLVVSLRLFFSVSPSAPANGGSGTLISDLRGTLSPNQILAA